MSSCVSSFYIDLKPEMDRMFKMLHYFHPEVTDEVFTPEYYHSIPFPHRKYMYPYSGIELSKKYHTVTHIDADVLIVDRLDELFDESSDARAGRDNSDNNRAGPTPGFELPGIDWKHYLNAGIHSVTGEEFWNDWMEFSLDHGDRIQFGENGTLNEVFYSGKYNTVLLDPIESNIHYGTSFQEGTSNWYWESWKKIVVVGDHLEINNKRIKMLHMAGTTYPKPQIKDLFTKEVQDFIQEILCH